MRIINKLNIIARIDQLIRLKSTGTPNELAQRLNLSERQARRYIEEMKDMGADIKYNERLITYEYLQPIQFKCGFFKK